MAGTNPYVEEVNVKRPTKRFSVTIIKEETGEKTVVNVDPDDIPYGRTGLEGSVLDIALGAGVDVDHACGGVCACATCHVHITAGLKSCSEATDDELDQLDSARELTLESRLSCHCVPDGTENLIAVIPAWNKNMVSEGH